MREHVAMGKEHRFWQTIAYMAIAVLLSIRLNYKAVRRCGRMVKGLDYDSGDRRFGSYPRRDALE